jgi:hypothetical protein
MEIIKNKYWKKTIIHHVIYNDVVYIREECEMFTDFHDITWSSEDKETIHYYYFYPTGWSGDDETCNRHNPPPDLEIEFKKSLILKREDFINKGWVFMSEFDNEIIFTKGDVYKDNGQGAFLSVKDNHIVIETTDVGFNQDGPNISVKFNGECNTPDEFDMICKMIGLKI